MEGGRRLAGWGMPRLVWLEYRKKPSCARSEILGASQGSLMSSAREVLIGFAVLRKCSSCKVESSREGTKSKGGAIVSRLWQESP